MQYTTIQACAIVGISPSYFRKVARAINLMPARVEAYRTVLNVDAHKRIIDVRRHHWDDDAVLAVMYATGR